MSVTKEPRVSRVCGTCQEPQPKYRKLVNCIVGVVMGKLGDKPITILPNYIYHVLSISAPHSFEGIPIDLDHMITNELLIPSPIYLQSYSNETQIVIEQSILEVNTLHSDIPPCVDYMNIDPAIGTRIVKCILKINEYRDALLEPKQVRESYIFPCNKQL
jgi:hypothetical protein